eukprot:c16435_g1_i4.p1 GENE.c16435_g1_i4~~c16435_g1_i4.p1  ORF type:complete len:290 (+),score=63.40 c16435_g1_i4:866-1735(+)
MGSIPSSFQTILHNQQKPGFLNMLKAKYDEKVRKRQRFMKQQVVGKLSEQDLFELCKSLGVPITVEKAREVCVGGFISFERFLEVVIVDKSNPILKLPSLNGLKRFFDEYDLDGNGTIKMSEMAEVYKKQTGKRLPDKLLKQQMAAGDANQDGVVDFEEYVAMMTADAEQLVAAAKVDRTEERVRANTSECGKLIKLIDHALEPIRDSFEESVAGELKNISGILEKANRAEIASDFPGILVHLLTGFALMMRLSEISSLSPEARETLVKCAHAIRSCTEAFKIRLKTQK